MQFELVVHAALVGQGAGRRAAHPVPCAVHAGAGRAAGFRDEALGGQGGQAGVAEGDLCAREVQLAALPVGHGPQPPVEDVRAHAGQRAADHRGGAGDRCGGGVDGALGGTVQVEGRDRSVGGQRHQVVPHGGRYGLTAQVQPQREFTGCPPYEMGAQQRPQRRGGVEVGDPRRAQEGGEAPRVLPGRVVGQDERVAPADPEPLLHGGVGGQAGEPRHAAGGCGVTAGAVQRAGEVGDVGVRDLDRLGRAGGAGGVDEVGGGVARDGGLRQRPPPGRERRVDPRHTRCPVVAVRRHDHRHTGPFGEGAQPRAGVGGIQQGEGRSRAPGGEGCRHEVRAAGQDDAGHRAGSRAREPQSGGKRLHALVQSGERQAAGGGEHRGTVRVAPDAVQEARQRVGRAVGHRIPRVGRGRRVRPGWAGWLV